MSNTVGFSIGRTMQAQWKVMEPVEGAGGSPCPRYPDDLQRFYRVAL